MSRHFFVAACAVTLLGCSSAGEQTAAEDVGSVDQPIINGTLSAAGRAEAQGWILVSRSGGICTGSLIRNDLVLTARHCTTTDGTPFGPADDTMAHYALQMGPAANNRGVSQVFRHASLDVAVLALPEFLPMVNNNRYDWVHEIYTGTNASLQGKNALCYGYGATSITQCNPPPANGNGAGLLREDTLKVSSTSSTGVSFGPASGGQVQWVGDSGGSCIYNGWITGVQSTSSCNQSPLKVLAGNHVGPQAFRSWVYDIIAGRGAINIHNAEASTISGHITTLNHPDFNSQPGAFLQVSQLWNRWGFSGVYNNNNVGLWYNTSTARWTVFNQGFATMPTNASFNVWKTGPGWTLTANAANTPPGIPHVSQVDFGSAGANGNPNLMLIVSQNWNGTYNNRPIGVWFDPVTAHWYVYNEDGQPVPAGARFNITLVSNVWGGFIHTSSAGTVTGNSTYLDNPNLNGQPNAQFVFTHNFKLGGGNGGIFHNHALGAWFDASRQRWAIFNQDMTAMPTNLTFNVMVRP